MPSAKVHGPISNNKIYLHYCDRDGRRPAEVVIREDEEGGYQLEEVESLPAQLRERFRAVEDLVRAVRVTASQLELTSPLHPSEFDRDRGLLLCR